MKNKKGREKIPNGYSKIIFLNRLSEIDFSQKAHLIIYDKKLPQVNPRLKKWLEKQPLTYGLSAGEKLKSLSSFSIHVQKILKKIEGYNKNQLCILALGGGSLGDFVGFMASVIKRGIPLIQMPSTWLASADSAHGGKNALNVLGKNQLGTFYFAKKIIIVKEILNSQTQEQEEDALGEYIKSAWISPSPLFEGLKQKTSISKKWLWQYLPDTIRIKYKVIKKDPFENQGIRYWLNLGHTLGHILETHYQYSHGRAVAQGLIFAVNWSQSQTGLSEVEYQELLLSFPKKFIQSLSREKHKAKPLTKKQFLNLAKKDKKISDSDKVNFVFLKKKFRPLVKPVSFSDFYKEAKRQGWCV